MERRLSSNTKTEGARDIYVDSTIYGLGLVALPTHLGDHARKSRIQQGPKFLSHAAGPLCPLTVLHKQATRPFCLLLAASTSIDVSSWCNTRVVLARQSGCLFFVQPLSNLLFQAFQLRPRRQKKKKRATLLLEYCTAPCHRSPIARNRLLTYNMSTPKVYAHLLPPSWKGKVAEWLKEDCPSFDWGGYVVGEDVKRATLWCKTRVSPAGW